MSTARNADTKTQWFQDNFPGADLKLSAKTMVEVLHTTEGTSWPEYGGDGSTAPNMTGLPPLMGNPGKWRAHFPDEKSSRALQNLDGGVQTNTLNAHQIELIGTCDPRNKVRWGGTSRTRLAGRDYVFWPNADEKQLKWVGRMLAGLHLRHGLRLVAPRQFLPYPDSYGSTRVRLNGAEWSNVTGVVGHQHVPENSHGDPGNIDIDFILNFAKAYAAKRKS
jgi:hypothetical protein